MRKYTILILVVISVMLILQGCGSGSDSDGVSGDNGTSNSQLDNNSETDIKDDDIALSDFNLDDVDAFTLSGRTYSNLTSKLSEDVQFKEEGSLLLYKFGAYPYVFYFDKETFSEDSYYVMMEIQESGTLIHDFQPVGLSREEITDKYPDYYIRKVNSGGTVNSYLYFDEGGNICMTQLVNNMASNVVVSPKKAFVDDMMAEAFLGRTYRDVKEIMGKNNVVIQSEIGYVLTNFAVSYSLIFDAYDELTDDSVVYMVNASNGSYTLDGLPLFYMSQEEFISSYSSKFNIILDDSNTDTTYFMKDNIYGYVRFGILDDQNSLYLTDRQEALFLDESYFDQISVVDVSVETDQSDSETAVDAVSSDFIGVSYNELVDYFGYEGSSREDQGLMKVSFTNVPHIFYFRSEDYAENSVVVLVLTVGEGEIWGKGTPVGDNHSVLESGGHQVLYSYANDDPTKAEFAYFNDGIFSYTAGIDDFGHIAYVTTEQVDIGITDLGPGEFLEAQVGQMREHYGLSYLLTEVDQTLTMSYYALHYSFVFETGTPINDDTVITLLKLNPGAYYQGHRGYNTITKEEFMALGFEILSEDQGTNTVYFTDSVLYGAILFDSEDGGNSVYLVKDKTLFGL